MQVAEALHKKKITRLSYTIGNMVTDGLVMQWNRSYVAKSFTVLSVSIEIL